MSWIRTVGEDEASPELAALYAAVVDPQSGQLDHILSVHGLHPAGLSAHYALYRAVMAGTRGLRTVEREMVALIVSTVNECHY